MPVCAPRPEAARDEWLRQERARSKNEHQTQKRTKPVQAPPAASRSHSNATKKKKPPMMAIRIVLYGIVAFVVARRNRNKTGGATAGR